MRILVTGGAGFIGTNLIKELISLNHDVFSLDNYDSGLIENHIKGATYIKGDIEEIQFFDKHGHFDVCFHLAALSRIQPSFQNPLECTRVNTTGTHCVLEYARKNSSRGITKIVYAGSSSKWHEPSISPYATSKYLGEELCKMYKNVYGINVEICRFYNVYGPHEITEGDYSAVVGKFRNQVINNQPLTIVGDGEQRRDFTWVGDIVDGLIRVAFTNEKHEDAWELGSGYNYSINELYALFELRFKDITYVYLPEQPGNYRETLRENDDALDRLGWKPTNKLEEYISMLHK